ncbi:ISL3 family transposase [Streptomyces sp. NBC_01304]|uniref:ISL3 family transposase n=1 Tax=Streptomyces sp. NBC_01304 TaxID=2903818 RepID=UPI002E146490|nr:ISL3 family transposase [Streptomyces sp. NBC_01304]
MGAVAIEDVLFPGIDVRVTAVHVSAERVAVEASSCGSPPVCPDCGWRGRRVHSRYVRRVAERPVVGRTLAIWLSVRRFFCERASCQRRTFVEQVPDLSERYRRNSVGLRRWMETIATFLGGRPGERLCRVLQLPAGRTHLLGLLTAPVVPEQAPRVLGVDEFAFRKGWRYGTVLVDIEAARVVDVLPDRDAATFTTWLREHPGAEIICRDRASAYSSAVRQAAPNAQEIADRWHLLNNLSSAVEKTCHQHRSCLRKQAEADRDAEPRRIINPLPPPTLPPTKIAVRTVDRYSDIHRLLGQGCSVSEISRRLHLDRKTVRRFRDTDLDELLASARHGRPKGVLEPYTAYLTERFTDGVTSPTDLFREIRQRGYQGSDLPVRRYVAGLRTGTVEPARGAVPSPRKITTWIMLPRGALKPREEEQLLKVRLACPDITRACDLARAFHDLLQHRRGHQLLEWVRQAEHDAPSPILSFAQGLCLDLDAVTAGLTLPWSSGIVEGHVNRIKTIKRAMYGRASFRLLRTRILLRS